MCLNHNVTIYKIQLWSLYLSTHCNVMFMNFIHILCCLLSLLLLLNDYNINDDSSEMNFRFCSSLLTEYPQRVFEYLIFCKSHYHSFGMGQFEKSGVFELNCIDNCNEKYSSEKKTTKNCDLDYSE